MTDSKMTPARVVERLESLAFVAEHDRFTAEYESMAETVRALEAERDRLRGAGDALAEAAYLHMGTHPVFRMKPTGFEGSRARLQQEDQIASENTLMAAVKEWKSDANL